MKTQNRIAKKLEEFDAKAKAKAPEAEKCPACNGEDTGTGRKCEVCDGREWVSLSMTEADVAWVVKKWPQASGSVHSVHVVNLIQFLQPAERIHFANELFRVLVPGAKVQIVSPHWCSSRAFSDMAFVYPPVAEGWYFHLNKDWRAANAPWGKAYRCDFDVAFGYGLHQLIIPRNQEYQQHAVTFWKEAAQDLIVTISKR